MHFLDFYDNIVAIVIYRVTDIVYWSVRDLYGSLIQGEGYRVEIPSTHTMMSEFKLRILDLTAKYVLIETYNSLIPAGPWVLTRDTYGDFVITSVGGAPVFFMLQLGQDSQFKIWTLDTAKYEATPSVTEKVDELGIMVIRAQ